MTKFEKARVRRDILADEECPPIMDKVGNIHYSWLILNQEFDSCQPDNYGDEEFNLFIIDKHNNLFRAMSIDFEFEPFEDN